LIVCRNFVIIMAEEILGDFLSTAVLIKAGTETDYIKNCFEEYKVATDPSGCYMSLYRMRHMIGLELGISVASVGIRARRPARRAPSMSISMRACAPQARPSPGHDRFSVSYGRPAAASDWWYSACAQMGLGDGTGHVIEAQKFACPTPTGATG